MVVLTALTVEGRTEPLGVEVASPRFAWHVESDEQGTVAEGFEVAVRHGDEVVWSASGVGFHADYAGPALEPATRYAWSVSVRTNHGDAEDASFFETGLPEPAWSASRWIGAPPSSSPDDESGTGTTGAQAAPLLRTEFAAGAVVGARLYLAAGGIADARLNGAPVSDEVLGPGLSDWDERVQYSVTDVTELIRPGANAITLELGRGFYGITTDNVWDWHRAPWHAEPSVRALLRLTHPDGSVTEIGTSQQWRLTEGPTRFDSFYEGSVWDAAAARPGADLPDYDDADWAPATEVTGPRGRLDARRQPPIRIVETVAPMSVERRRGADGEDGWRVWFPRQVAGWVRVRVPAASTVTLRYAESIGENGDPVVDDFFTQGRFQSDVVRASGPIEWEPQFCYFGFQVVDVDGWPGELTADAIEARVLHSDVARVGGFEASDPVLGRMHEAAIQTVLNNLHHVPTDTPVYEKNGWTGDAVLAAELMLRSLDVAPLLDQWLDHIADSTDADGRPALIAPDPDWVWPGYEESPPWNAIVVLLPWSLYQATGDDRMLRRHFDAALRYLRLEHTTAAGHLSQSGLGDYIPPDANGNPPEDLAVAGTAHVYLATRVLAEWARVSAAPSLRNSTPRPRRSATHSTRSGSPPTAATRMPSAAPARPTRCLPSPSASCRRMPRVACSTRFWRTSRRATTTSGSDHSPPSTSCGS